MNIYFLLNSCHCNENNSLFSFFEWTPYPSCPSSLK